MKIAPFTLIVPARAAPPLLAAARYATFALPCPKPEPVTMSQLLSDVADHGVPAELNPIPNEPSPPPEEIEAEPGSRNIEAGAWVIVIATPFTRTRAVRPRLLKLLEAAIERFPLPEPLAGGSAVSQESSDTASQTPEDVIANDREPPVSGKLNEVGSTTTLAVAPVWVTVRTASFT